MCCVKFYFDANLRLQEVLVKCLADEKAAAAFASLEKLFTEKYGFPTRREGGKSPRVFWQLPTTTIRLVHLNVFGISRVNFVYASKAHEPQ